MATGLGLPAPAATTPLVDLDPSPALSQIGGTWPTDGRMVGIVVDPDGDLTGLEQVKGASMVPLVVAPRGGKLSNGLYIQRAFATTRSVEYDVVLLASCPVPAPDAQVSRDSRAGDPAAAVLYPRVALLLSEAFRHAKAIGAWGAGVDALVDAGLSQDAAGVVVADDPAAVFTGVHQLLGAHRVWALRHLAEPGRGVSAVEPAVTTVSGAGTALRRFRRPRRPRLSWRDDVSEHTHDDMDGLLSTALEMAEDQLRSAGQLLPFAVAVDESGERQLRAVDSPGATTSLAIDDLVAGLRDERASLRACAVVYDVALGDGDAVQVAVEHRDAAAPAPALLMALAYRRAGRRLQTGGVTAASGSRRIW